MSQRETNKMDLVRSQGTYVTMPTFFLSEEKIQELKEKGQFETQLDLEAFRFQVAKMFSYKVGIIVAGLTGERSTTKEGEDRLLTVQARKKMDPNSVHGPAPLVVAASSNSTSDACDFTRDAFKDGADGVLSSVPYNTDYTQPGLLQHFGHIAEAADGNPLIIYNNPTRTGGDGIKPVTFRQLVGEFPHIVGMLERNPEQLNRETIGSYPENVRIWSGNDKTFLDDMIERGAFGVVSDIANVDPTGVQTMIKHIKKEEIEEARKIFTKRQRLRELIFDREGHPTGLKGALHKAGVGNGLCRLPVTTPSKKLLDDLHDEMGDELHLI